MSKKSWNKQVDPTKDKQTRKKKMRLKLKQYKTPTARDLEEMSYDDYDDDVYNWK